MEFSKRSSVDIPLPGLRHRPQNDLHPSPIPSKSPRVPRSFSFASVSLSPFPTMDRWKPHRHRTVRFMISQRGYPAAACSSKRPPPPPASLAKR